MKGDVKRNTSATTGDRDDIQPKLRRSALGFAFRQIHGDVGSTAISFLAQQAERL
jgi:hypothetical protein